MKKILFPALGLIFLLACNEPLPVLNDAENTQLKSGNSESSTFTLSGSIDIGSKGAAEISAFDPITNRLFVVNNSAGNNRIEVVDFSDPSSPSVIDNINTAIYGGLVNSVSVSNGKLAAAIEATVKTNNGKVLVFNTGDYSVLATVEVGALPDMVAFSPDGNMIISANEGEPNDAYTIDPVGTVSIILVNEDYNVTTLDFSGFESRADELKAKGFRIFGKNASFAQDINPSMLPYLKTRKQHGLLYRRIMVLL